MLRRIAFLAALLSPVATVAQSAGTMTFAIDGTTKTPLYIGPATCQGSSALTMTWTTAFSTTGTTLPPSGSMYSIYASTSTITCSASSISLTSLNSAAIAASTTSATQTWPGLGDAVLTPGAFVKAAGLDCTKPDSAINVCVRLIGSDGQTVVGTATGVVYLQTAPPSAPTNVSVQPGDSRLYVSWDLVTATPTVDHYVVQATSQSNSSDVHQSGNTTDNSNYPLTGLVNGTTYDVVVFAYSKGDVASQASSPSVPGTPVPVSDFWDSYGGREKGGCATGAGGLLALVGVVAALRRTRRKP